MYVGLTVSLYNYLGTRSLYTIAVVENGETRPLVSTPAHSKLVFWYSSKTQVLFEIMVQIKQKRGIGVENPSERSFVGGYIGGYIGRCIYR